MQVQERIIATVYGRWAPYYVANRKFVLRAFTHPVNSSGDYGDGDGGDHNKRISVPDEIITGNNHDPHSNRNIATIRVNKSQTPILYLQETIASFPPFIFSVIIALPCLSFLSLFIFILPFFSHHLYPFILIFPKMQCLYFSQPCLECNTLENNMGLCNFTTLGIHPLHYVLIHISFS